MVRVTSVLAKAELVGLESESQMGNSTSKRNFKKKSYIAVMIKCESC